MITEIKYTNPERTHVDLTLDTGEGHSGIYEGTRAWRKLVQPYLDSGKTIKYVAPPPEPVQTDRDRLESRTGMTIIELKAVLDIN